MLYQALYRKYRPKTFNDVAGQEVIVKTLKNIIKNNKLTHAYLFIGPRGTGKTSIAKIFAKTINCENSKDGISCENCDICISNNNNENIDVIEMDAASNNGVDEIREIKNHVTLLPTMSKYKVYIIDEVHMLTTGAFNALLKTLEEPPEHVKFILATTEPQKLPATILSRCQRFDFKRISNEDIVKDLEYVCKESDIKITPKALELIAVLAEGGMRDALSILERCSQEGNDEINEDKVKDLVGIPKTVFINNIVESVVNEDIEGTLNNLEEVIEDGKDINNLVWEIIKYVKDILLYKSTGKTELYNDE